MIETKPIDIAPVAALPATHVQADSLTTYRNGDDFLASRLGGGIVYLD